MRRLIGGSHEPLRSVLSCGSEREREAKATPGEWRVEDYRADGDWRSTGLIWAKEEHQYYSPGTAICQVRFDLIKDQDAKTFEANTDFIAHSRTDIPKLLALVASQSAEMERLREGLRFYAQKPEPDITSEFAKSAGEWGETCATWEPLTDLGARARAVLSELEESK